MAKKKEKEINGAQTSVLVIIICLLVIALAYMIGRDYIASMFKPDEGSNPIFRPLGKHKDTHPAVEKEDDNNVKETPEAIEEEKTEPVAEEVKEEPKPEAKKDIKQEIKKKVRKITKQESEDVKTLENVDRDINTRQSDAELLESVDRRINQEQANE